MLFPRDRWPFIRQRTIVVNPTAIVAFDITTGIARGRSSSGVTGKPAAGLPRRAALTYTQAHPTHRQSCVER